ncbi:hypothetical protein [Arthrobacter sp.]|uniref:hypothetical protein n=1 Tax=Arthrobacter sp. TaxID=1667 RepID=UPI002810CA9F|nr:hypothetical protein [Arthrobacter sp.]
MDEPTRVSVQFLKEAIAVLLQHLEEVEGPEIGLEKDYFWSIPPERLYDVYNEPSSFTIGQLTESLGNLEKMVDDPTRVLSYGLVSMADVLRAVGQEVLN